MLSVIVFQPHSICEEDEGSDERGNRDPGLQERTPRRTVSRYQHKRTQWYTKNVVANLLNPTEAMSD